MPSSTGLAIFHAHVEVGILLLHALVEGLELFDTACSKQLRTILRRWTEVVLLALYSHSEQYMSIILEN